MFFFLWHTLFTFLLVSFVIPNNALNLIIIKNHEILILFYSLPLYCAIFFIENASLVLNDLNIFLLGFSVKVGSFLVCLEALHRNYVYLLPPSPFLVCLFVLSFYCYFFFFKKIGSAGISMHYMVMTWLLKVTSNLGDNMKKFAVFSVHDVIDQSPILG